MCLLLQQGVERFGHSVEAFCFMSNHIHLAIRVSEISISRIIHHLAFRFTRYINRNYNRVGHLFQGRFKSILVNDEDYLKELVRYIHLNPVRAGIVADPECYLWSSHRAYMGLADIAWLSKDKVLKKFHHEKEYAIDNLKKYVLMGVGTKTPFDFKSGCKKGILGDPDFVDEVLTKVKCNSIKIVELSDLIVKVCELNEITQSEVKAPGKHSRQSQARALLALLVRESNNLSLESLGAFLGRGSSGLSKIANRFEMKCARDKVSAEKLKKMRSWLSNNKEE